MQSIEKSDNSGDVCEENADCSRGDINMVCKNNKCQCRTGMKYNSRAQECQVKIIKKKMFKLYALFYRFFWTLIVASLTTIAQFLMWLWMQQA